MAKRTRRCVDCKTDISDRGNAAQRCLGCMDQLRARRRKLGARTCQGCRREYMPRGHLQKWCTSCVWDAASRSRMVKRGFADLERYRRDLASGTRTSICQVCSKPFTYKYLGGMDRKYCDIDLPKATAAGRDAQSRRGTRPLDVPRSCVVCDGAFYPTHPQQKYCTECATTKSERARARRYGLSSHQVQTMRNRFDGLCWICRSTPGRCVDHDHQTGRVRGWLCPACNGALHYVERPDWMTAATAYLAGGAADDGNAAVALGGGRSAL